MSTLGPAQRLEVSRHDLRQSRLVADPQAAPLRPLAEGEARLRIDHFALTSNNITYAAFGEAMKYWDFFPTFDSAWGCIPVWGFAEVVESKADGVLVGERCYGYWPMGHYLVVQPTRVSARGFVDGSAHRQGLAAAYNQVQRCAADPQYRATQEAQQAILRPLFITSFLIDDFLVEQGFFGAGQVLLSSASSKTAYGTAFCLSRRRGAPEAARVIGLTSAANLDHCRSMHCCDEVLDYAALASLNRNVPTVFVDFAGNAKLRRTVHEHFGDLLRYSCSVGATHWEDRGHGHDLPGPRPTLFFAPAQMARRSAPPPEGWGPGGLNERVADAWQAFMLPVNDPVQPWLRVRTGVGAAAVREAIAALLDGTLDPRDGYMLSLRARGNGRQRQAAARWADIPGNAHQAHAMPDATLSPITRALPDLSAWAARFLASPIPVLPETAEAIESLRANEDEVDAHLVAGMIGGDPLMNLKLLAHVAQLGAARQATTPETVTAALVWLGIGPFFRAFDVQPTVDQVLCDQAEALAGLHQVLQRAHRASAFALAFAVHRMDSDAPVIHAATLLHDFAEMLLWLHAPALALRVAQAQHVDPTLRSAVVQRQLLNIELNDLQQTLMRAWKLPVLLVRINDERHADSPAVRNVLLAVRLARHSALDWDNAALSDDVRDIAALLNLGALPTQKLLRDIDA